MGYSPPKKKKNVIMGQARHPCLRFDKQTHIRVVLFSGWSRNFEIRI